MTMKETEPKHPYQAAHTYNESMMPQADQKYKGWYYDHISKEFYRWDNFPRLTK